MAFELTECMTPEYDQGPCHCPFCDPQTETLRDLIQQWINRQTEEV